MQRAKAPPLAWSHIELTGKVPLGHMCRAARIPQGDRGREKVLHHEAVDLLLQLPCVDDLQCDIEPICASASSSVGWDDDDNNTYPTKLLVRFHEMKWTRHLPASHRFLPENIP